MSMPGESSREVTLRAAVWLSRVLPWLAVVGTAALLVVVVTVPSLSSSVDRLAVHFGVTARFFPYLLVIFFSIVALWGFAFKTIVFLSHLSDQQFAARERASEVFSGIIDILRVLSKTGPGDASLSTGRPDLEDSTRRFHSCRQASRRRSRRTSSSP
jgi:fatty acid desaturase